MTLRERLLPFLRWLPLQRQMVRADIVAGATVAMVLIPPVGESFALSASEARLIAMLITKDPEPVRRQDLIELFGIKSPNIRRIDTTIYRLRHKIEQNTGYPSPFSTVHGVGYRNEGLSATVPLSF